MSKLNNWLIICMCAMSACSSYGPQDVRPFNHTEYQAFAMTLEALNTPMPDTQPAVLLFTDSRDWTYADGHGYVCPPLPTRCAGPFIRAAAISHHDGSISLWAGENGLNEVPCKTVVHETLHYVYGDAGHQDVALWGSEEQRFREGLVVELQKEVCDG